MRFYVIIFVLLGFCFSGFAQEESKPYLIHSIYFGGGDYYIDDAQKEKLYNFLLAIPDIDEYEISVHGHTDDIGTYEYNQWLSENRSEMTVRQIMLHNIQREKILIKDFGEFNPVYDNSTFEGKLKNRRVDIILKKPEA